MPSPAKGVGAQAADTPDPRALTAWLPYKDVNAPLSGPGREVGRLRGIITMMTATLLVAVLLESHSQLKVLFNEYN